MDRELRTIKAELLGLEEKLKSLKELAPAEQGQLFKRLAVLRETLTLTEKIKILRRTLAENQKIMQESKDLHLVALAREEKEETEAVLNQLVKKLEERLSPESLDIRSVILELRAGTGGNEASLFAAELARMYSRYALKEGFTVQTLSQSESESGGVKELTLRIAGSGAYGRFKFESGVHRVQRVPVTEAKGRIHTSTASVAVLPEPEKTELPLDNKDLKIDTFRSSGHGGQSVNTTDSAVRVTHLPTGLAVSVQNERSQAQNKEKALKILKTRLLAMEEEKMRRRESQERKSQIGSAERSEKIRTYNFPQNRLTDHRLNKSWHNLGQILDGQLDALINELAVSLKS